MSTPLALTAVAALAAASQFAKRGSRSKLSEADKDRIVELVRSGRVGEARELSASLGQERLDLSGANLTNAGLHRADLTGASLAGANLFGANLSEATLSEADLAGADLRWVSMSEADLSGADLSGADLAGADLRGAHLRGADLSEARLYRANLMEANLSEADLTGANLSGARFVQDAIGVDLGPDRVFKGIPDGYRIQRSRLSERTTLAPVAPPRIADLRLAARRLRRGASIGEAYGFELYSGD